MDGGEQANKHKLNGRREKIMLCPKCGNQNGDTASTCTKCGTALAPITQGLSTSSVRQPPDIIDFYKAIIGPKNQDYYLRHFLRFDANGKAGITWHWPAFFTTFFWLIYRKMWLNALLYWLLPFVMLIPVLIIAAMFSETGAYLAYPLYLAGIFFLPPMYTNALYYKHCKKRIAESRSSSNDVQWQLGELSGKGGTSNVVIIFVIIISLVAIIGILAAIAIPQFITFRNRASTAQAIQAGKSATEYVTNYYIQNKQIPFDIKESGPLPRSVKNISLDAQTGIITVTMANELDGKSLLFIPYSNTDNQITWKCISDDIQETYLPKECRRSEMK
jgi:type II secretory pathway pseudopilin PulG/ribosomal protein L40E